MNDRCIKGSLTFQSRQSVKFAKISVRSSNDLNRTILVFPIILSSEEVEEEDFKEFL